MKDQMVMKVLTSSFIYSHSKELLIVVSVLFLAIVYAMYFVSLYNFVAMVGAIGIIAHLACNWGHKAGVEDGVESTLESLIASGLFETEVRDDDTIVKRVDDLVYFDECQKCEGGMVLNPSATKGHKYNGKKEEEI